MAKSAKKAPAKKAPAPKKPAPAPAKKPAVKKAATVAAKPKKPALRGKLPAYSPQAKFVNVAEENPSRKGSIAHKMFAKIQKSATFGDYRKKGGALHALYWFEKRGYLTIQEVPGGKPVKMPQSEETRRRAAESRARVAARRKGEHHASA